MTNKHLKLQKLSVVLSVLSVAVAQKAPASSRTPPPPHTFYNVHGCPGTSVPHDCAG